MMLKENCMHKGACVGYCGWDGSWNLQLKMIKVFPEDNNVILCLQSKCQHALCLGVPHMSLYLAKTRCHIKSLNVNSVSQLRMSNTFTYYMIHFQH